MAIACLIAAGGLASAAQARDLLGIFEGWGAFRDPDAARCYAIAEPAAPAGRQGRWRPFAAIGYWPRLGVRGQVNIRLSRALAPGSAATLRIGERSFALDGGAADVWAKDRRDDAAIVAAMRAGAKMSVGGRTREGGRFSDDYGLRGAATAIDAAALGCARLR